MHTTVILSSRTCRRASWEHSNYRHFHSLPWPKVTGVGCHDTWTLYLLLKIGAFEICNTEYTLRRTSLFKSPACNKRPQETVLFYCYNKACLLDVEHSIKHQCLALKMEAAGTGNRATCNSTHCALLPPLKCWYAKTANHFHNTFSLKSKILQKLEKGIRNKQRLRIFLSYNALNITLSLRLQVS